VLREIRIAATDLRPIVVSGPEAEAERLGLALSADGDEQWVRVLAGRHPGAYDLEGAALLVHVVEGEPTREDEELFRRAGRKDVPVVCVLVDRDQDGPPEVPHVLATEIVVARRGDALPLDAIVEQVASRLDEKAYALAGKLPAIRRHVCERIVDQFARQNAILGAAVFIPGADLPVMTLNQIRMVLRLAAAYGEELNRERAAEILGVVGAGVGLRAVARQLLGVVPIAGWAVKGGIGYAGTKTLGEAAIRYFEAGGTKTVLESVRPRS
jgi:uncharacterized protein (DUF697 family)